jgi:hypothetical protein
MVLAENLILDGQTIPLNSSANVTINPVTGDITATSSNGNLSCAEVGDPPTLTLSANPTTVNSGESSTLSWTVGNSATSCTKTGSWSGGLTAGQITNGSHNEVITNITMSSTYSLQCSNQFGSSLLRTAVVNVNGGNPECSAQPPILGGAEDFTVRLIPGTPFGQVGSPPNPATYDGTYDDIAPGTGWPGVYGTQSFATLTKNNYVAMQFTTDNTNAIAKLVFTTPGNGQGPPSSATTVAISECPGDFTTHLNQNKCLSVGGATPNLRWSQNSTTNGATHCLLDKNKTYYLNIVHSNSTVDGYATTGCGSTTTDYCGMIFSQTNEN